MTVSYHSHEEFINRSAKLKSLREAGLEPYPHKFRASHLTKELIDRYSQEEIGNSEDALEAKTPSASISGRLVLFRAMGKNAFAQLQDSSGRLQVMFNRDASKVLGYDPDSLGLSHIKFIEKKLDLGDIIGLEGELFHTGKGELTLFVKKLSLLCKTLLPLADKHSGLNDKETRYRKRWLDLISNPEVKESFILRSKIIQIIRGFFEEQSFLEVETPILQSIYGGANARPFITHFNELDEQRFLRISLEIPLKKLIVGGFDRVFEIGKVFRNEGIDSTHNPEFTEVEAYAAGWDYHDMMQAVETLFEKIALKLFGKTSIPYQKQEGQEPIEVELKAPWKRISMLDSLEEYAQFDAKNASKEDLVKKLCQVSSFEEKDCKDFSKGILVAKLFEELVEDKLIQPHHIIDHPLETTPLCKYHRDPKWRAEGYVERFESFIVGKEFCNSYSELNDPELQRDLLLSQKEKKAEGDEEAHPLDEEFIEAICQGMPPCGGLGIGVDRMCMLFCNCLSIRDVLFFPFMKAESTD